MQFMFSNISWLEYLAFIIVSAVVYYVFVLFTYYRHDLLQITKMAAPANASNFTVASNKRPGNGEDIASKSVETNQSQPVQSFTDEVSAYLEEAARNEVSKEALLQCLGLIANKYPSLASSEFKESLDQFIKLQTETYCAMFLSEVDLNKVWRES